MKLFESTLFEVCAHAPLFSRLDRSSLFSACSRALHLDFFAHHLSLKMKAQTAQTSTSTRPQQPTAAYAATLPVETLAP